jgi:hypothetical protein
MTSPVLQLRESFEKQIDLPDPYLADAGSRVLYSQTLDPVVQKRLVRKLDVIILPILGEPGL